MNTYSSVLNEITGEICEQQVETSIEWILDESSGDFIQMENTSTPISKNIIDSSGSKSKKRKADPQKWMMNVRKRARMCGASFIDITGDTKPMKTMRPPCHGCRLICYERVTEELRLSFFEKYYRLSTTRLKWEFILRYTRSTAVKTTKKDSRRSYSRLFFIGTGLHHQGSEEFVKVCKKMFLNTLCISDSMVRKAHEKITNKDGVLNDDLRGGHVRTVSGLKQQQREWVHKHINSFPKVNSHYVRAKCDKLFLDSELSVTKMYNLYLEFIPNDEMKVTERIYRDIFNTEFDLHFHTLKKDSCDKCTQYQNATQGEKSKLEIAYLNHLRQKDLARSLKNSFKDEAKTSGDTLCAIFDYEKGITLPRAEASSFYYKRKLTVHNFTVYDTVQKQAFNFMYDESLTGCGPNEVCSCLYKFIEYNVKLGVKNFLFVSDNCPGQNHNKFLYTFYIFCAAKFKISIKHLFLVRGHTQSEVDSVHSVIERALKKRSLYIPQELYDIVQNSSKSHAYKVIKLQLNDVLNFKVRYFF